MLLPCQRLTLDWGCITRSTPMPKTASTQIAVIGIDIGKNSFHVVVSPYEDLKLRRP